MEDTKTNSSQGFGLNKYGVFAMSLATVFSVNAIAQDSTEIPTVCNGIAMQTTIDYKETVGINKTYSFPTKKNFRDRYRRIAQSDWFKKTHSGMSIGEVMTIEE